MRLILITHADGDHYGGLAALKALAPKAVICASQPEADAMARGQMSRPLKPKGLQGIFFRLVAPFVKSPPVKTDRVIQPGDSFAWLGGLVALDSKGHTPGHLSFWSQSTGILFAGDSVLVHGKELLPAHGGNCWDEKLGREAFERQLALKPNAILGGHGIKHLLAMLVALCVPGSRCDPGASLGAPPRKSAHPREGGHGIRVS